MSIHPAVKSHVFWQADWIATKEDALYGVYLSPVRTSRTVCVCFCKRRKCGLPACYFGVKWLIKLEWGRVAARSLSVAPPWCPALLWADGGTPGLAAGTAAPCELAAARAGGELTLSAATSLCLSGKMLPTKINLPLGFQRYGAGQSGLARLASCVSPRCVDSDALARLARANVAPSTLTAADDPHNTLLWRVLKRKWSLPARPGWIYSRVYSAQCALVLFSGVTFPSFVSTYIEFCLSSWFSPSRCRPEVHMVEGHLVAHFKIKARSLRVNSVGTELWETCSQ